MDPLLHTRRNNGLHKVNSEEGEDRKIGRKDNGYSFLRCTRHNSYRLSSVEGKRSTTITTQSYWTVQQHLKKKVPIWRRRNALPSRQRVHTCGGTDVKFNEFRYELLPHPTYSPDLASCDYFQFPDLKKWFGDLPPESSSSPKQRFILKGWTNIIRVA